jgi:hypothetical protein
MSLTGLSLVKKDTYFTFEFCQDAKNYSLAGLPYLGVPAIETFEGNIWDVFEANGFVYDFTLDVVRPILSIAQKTRISLVGNRYIANGLILPGSITDDGSRVKGYSAWYSRERLSWVYTEVNYV